MASIVWHKSAKEHLGKIFSYYATNVSKRIAYSILQDVLESVQHLEQIPQKGALEKLLENRKYEYRHLIVRRTYKVIYFIANEECHIVAIWDTRQNPDALTAEI